MGIGVSIVLIVAGAVLIWAVTDPGEMSVGDVTFDLHSVGWILLLVGVAGIIVALIMNWQRSRTKHTFEERRN